MTSLDELPVEILVRIYTFLGFHRYEVALTCQYLFNLWKSYWRVTDELVAVADGTYFLGSPIKWRMRKAMLFLQQRLQERLDQRVPLDDVNLSQAQRLVYVASQIPEAFWFLKRLLVVPRMNPSRDSNFIITAVKYSNTELIHELVLTDSMANFSVMDNGAFILMSSVGDVEAVSLLLKDDRIDPTTQENHALRSACKNGHVSVVEVLLADPRVQPTAMDDFATQWASRHGYGAIVDKLLKHQSATQHTRDVAISHASEAGHLEMVKGLLKDSKVNPASLFQSAIRLSSKNGHLDVVETLLTDPRVDPSAISNAAIRSANEEGHSAVVERLLRDTRVRIDPKTFPVPLRLIHSNPNGEELVTDNRRHRTEFYAFGTNNAHLNEMGIPSTLQYPQRWRFAYR
jgi:hypothetical protein